MSTQHSTYRVIDGDGHVIEDPIGIARHLPESYRNEFQAGRLSRMFPPMDHFHELPMIVRGSAERAAAGIVVGPDEWHDFLTSVGIEKSVLYPSIALSYGKVRDRDWSIAICGAYNDWLAATYIDQSPLFAGMALIPLQEPAAAVAELRRAVTDLGMKGAMLPSHGQALHLGSKEFWPIYEAAESLDCALAIHGGCHDGMGFDDMNVYAAVHALGHPFGQLISLAGMLFNGVFQRFPGLRVGYLEGGSAWLFLAIERFEESYESHIPYNDRSELLDLGESTDISEYLIDLLRTGRIFVGCEGGEHNLADVIKAIGHSPFFYSSDFPHEVDEDSCRHELTKLANLGVSEEDRQLTLAGNAERFYKL